MKEGGDALRLLLGFKARGWLRAMRRRLSTPSGLVFALLGLLVMGLWVGSLFLRARFAPPLAIEPGLREPLARGVLFALGLLAMSGAMAHRGLYLPAEEIERLFSAPIARAELVRYRLRVHSARTLPFALILGLVFAPRLAVPGFAFAGILLAVLCLTVVGQGAALAFGGAETRLGAWAARLPLAPLRIIVGLAFWLLFLALFFADELSEVAPDVFGGSGAHQLELLLLHPVYSAMTFPFAPWAGAITAASWAEFAPAFVLAIALWRLLVFAVERLPVDYRTLSLATSADVARRLSRLRSGRGMISGQRVSARALGWRVPWIFGRGAFGAVAWLQLCAIVRKSSGTLLFFAFVMGVLTLSTLVLGRGEAEAVGMGPESAESGALLALLGTVYLGMGLRFDFRSELDLMETMKAWPLPSWRIFLAVILPEVSLVSGLVLLALLLRALIVGAFPAGMLLVVGAVPLVAFVWTALDNAVFLLAPVRFHAEQGSSMHFAGRSIVLVFVRMLALLGLMFAAGGTFLLTRDLCSGLGEPWSLVAGISAMLGVSALAVFCLVAFGGWAFARYDVARQQIEAS